MGEVTNRNFEQVLSGLHYDLKNCSFISIDCEFSSLPSDSQLENSFFDTGDARYNNVRKHLHNSLVLQVGITPFKYQRNMNQFEAKPYKFHVFPRVFGPVNIPFLCTSSTIQFLADHDFDFNKVFHEGVSYFNRTNKELIIKYHRNGKLLGSLEENLSQNEAKEILRISEIVSKWKETCYLGDSMNYYVDRNKIVFNYLLKERVRLFDNELLTMLRGDTLFVKRVSKEEKLRYDEWYKSSQALERYVDSLSGFSRVFDMLSASKKPLVGHNLYFDLLLMYNQFYETLPLKYSEFKSTINGMFPFVYDTKLLSYQHNRLTKQNKFIDNSLGSLFESYQNTNTLFFQPHVLILANSLYSNLMEQKKHDAGWDSYMTGFVFLKLADQFVQLKRNTKSNENVTFIELMSSVDEFKNRINLARANVSYMNLEGDDPDSKRPPILYFESRAKQPLTKMKLDEIFQTFEPVHKKLLSTHTALLAVPNYASFKAILTEFNKSEIMKIEKYSLARHNRTVRACYAAVIILPLVLAAWAGYKSL